MAGVRGSARLDGIGVITQPDGIIVGGMYGFLLRQDDGGTGDDDVNYVHQATELFDNDQIKALPTTPLAIAVSPGLNRVALFSHAFGLADFSGGAYGSIDAQSSYNTWISWTGNQQVSNYSQNQIFANAFVTAVSWSSLHGLDANPTVTDPLFFVFTGSNKGFELNVFNGQDFTLGHASNTFRVSVLYYVLDLTTGLFVPVS